MWLSNDDNQQALVALFLSISELCSFFYSNIGWNCRDCRRWTESVIESEQNIFNSRKKLLVIIGRRKSKYRRKISISKKEQKSMWRKMNKVLWFDYAFAFFDYDWRDRSQRPERALDLIEASRSIFNQALFFCVFGETVIGRRTRRSAPRTVFVLCNALFVH